MQYVRLGDTGLDVSRLCLGSMTFGSPAWRPWVLDEEALTALDVELDESERARLEEPYQLRQGRGYV